jgi:hypothetical protein
MWEILLIISLLTGQLGRIQITPDIAVYFHDIVIFCYLIFHLKNIKIFFSTPFVIALGMYLLLRAGTLVGLLYVLRLFMYLSGIQFVLQSKKSQNYWFYWSYAVGIGYAILGFFQLLFYPDLRNLSYLGWDPHYYRLFSTLFDPNFVGCVIVLCLFLGTYLYTTVKSKFYIVFAQMLLLVALLLTYSRSSFVALIAGLIIYIYIVRKWKYLFFLVFIPLVIFLFPSFGGISTEIGRMWSVTARITNWQEGIHLFLNSPIIGNGFALRRIDSSILFILVTTGIIGFGFFMYLGVRLFRMGFTIQKKFSKAVYLSILMVLIVHSMFVNSLFYPQILIWFWVFIGAVVKKDVISRS